MTEIDEAELAELRAKAAKYDRGVVAIQEMRGAFQDARDADIPEILKERYAIRVAVATVSLSMIGVNDE